MGKNHFEQYLAVTLDNTIDEEFRVKYKSFWGLNMARLEPRFSDVYFEYLAEMRTDEITDIMEKVIKPLQGGFQFSFVTKLVHTLNPDMPIYDKMIGQFYLFPDISEIPNWDKKLFLAEKIYDFLKIEYQRIKDERLLVTAIEALNQFLTKMGIPPNDISETKKIDSLIWAWVSFQKNRFNSRKTSI